MAIDIPGHSNRLNILSMVPFLLLLPYVYDTLIFVLILLVFFVGVLHHAWPQNYFLSVLDVISLIILTSAIAYTTPRRSSIENMSVALIGATAAFSLAIVVALNVYTPDVYVLGIIGACIITTCMLVFCQYFSTWTYALLVLILCMFLVTYFNKNDFNLVHYAWSILHVLGAFLLFSVLVDLGLTTNANWFKY